MRERGTSARGEVIYRKPDDTKVPTARALHKAGPLSPLLDYSLCRG